MAKPPTQPSDPAIAKAQATADAALAAANAAQSTANAAQSSAVKAQATADAAATKVDLAALESRVAALEGAVKPPPEPLPSGDVYLELEMTDLAAISAAKQDWAQPWAYNPEFSRESTGLEYLRFSSDPDNLNHRLISWFMPIGSRTEVYFRYLLYIESDVAAGMTETGVKLPGPTRYPNEEISLRLEHALPANGNFPLVSYFYNAETGPGYGTITPLGATLNPGRWYCIEGHIKLNDIGQANGVTEIRVDDVQTYQRLNVNHRNDPAITLTHFHANVYHGGNTYPTKSPLHYRIAKIMVAAYWPGVPPNVSPEPPPIDPGEFPVWRDGAIVGEWVAIANTANLNHVNDAVNIGPNGPQGANTVDNWSGLGAGAHWWYSDCGGGHDANTALGWENKFDGIDLSADAPAWVLLNAGSPYADRLPASHYADGKPCSRHTYYTLHVIGDKVMSIGVQGAYSIGFPGGVYQGGGEVDGFDLGTNTWDAAGTHTSVPQAYQYIGAATCSHPVTGDVYVSHSQLFAKRLASTGAWSGLAVSADGSDSWWQFRATWIDVARNRWCHLDKARFTFIDLTSLAVTHLSITGAYTTRVTADGGGDINAGTEGQNCVVHDLDNDRYVVMQNGQAYALDPVSGGSSALGGPVASAVNGTCSRMAYFDELGGIAYLPRYTSNVLFLATR